MDVMQRWIAQRITSLLGFEDDIVVGTCVNYLSEEVRSTPSYAMCDLQLVELYCCIEELQLLPDASARVGFFLSGGR